VVLDWVQQDGRARNGRQILRAQGSEHHVSSLLHSIIYVGPDGPRMPQAHIRKHGVGRDINVDLAALQAVLLEEPTVVLRRPIPIASLHEGVPQQHREAMTVETPRAQPAVLKGAV
jgi:hypothetical protein